MAPASLCCPPSLKHALWLLGRRKRRRGCVQRFATAAATSPQHQTPQPVCSIDTAHFQSLILSAPAWLLGTRPLRLRGQTFDLHFVSVNLPLRNFSVFLTIVQNSFGIVTYMAPFVRATATIFPLTPHAFQTLRPHCLSSGWKFTYYLRDILKLDVVSFRVCLYLA